MSQLAKNIIEAIITDMTHRRGLRQEWDEIDDDIQQEIKDAWADLVDKALVDRLKSKLAEEETWDTESDRFLPGQSGEPC